MVDAVRAALEKGVARFIHTSSISAYGLHRGRIDESTEQWGGRSWINYQRSKYLAEEEVRKAVADGLHAVILNPASIIGAYDTSSWARFFPLVKEGKLPGVPPGAVSFCHSQAVAKAHLAAVDHGRRGENYLLGGADATFQQLIQAIGRALDQQIPAKPTPSWVLRLVARLGQWKSLYTGRPPVLTPEAVGMVTRRLFCDCSKAETQLGYRPVDLSTMVEDCHRWLVCEGKI